MHHTAAKDLHPAGMFAYITTDAAADAAIDIHLGAWLREWEIRRAKANFHVLPEHFLYKEIKGLFQIGERYVLIHIETFRLVEEAMRPCADRLVAVYPAGADDPDGGLLTLHCPGLYIAGMGTQQPVGVLIDIEGILHIPGRVVLGHVEGGEVMPVVFDLRTFCNGEAQSPEYIDDLVADQG